MPSLPARRIGGHDEAGPQHLRVNSAEPVICMGARARAWHRSLRSWSEASLLPDADQDRAVPFWQSMPRVEFRPWFRAHGKQVGSIMIPLGVSAAVTSIGAVAVDCDRGSRLAAAAVTAVVGITVAVNEPANEQSGEWRTDRRRDNPPA